MEIITIECPKCKGRLHVEEATEKLFCMYCRAEVVVKQATSRGESASLDSLVKRGFLSLEFSEWDKALDVFDRAADIDLEHAMIYVGKLLVELRLDKEENLAGHHKPLDGYVNYEKAIRFADSVLKKRLEGYSQAIKDRIAEQRAEDKRREKRKEKLIASQRQAEKEWWVRHWPKVVKWSILILALIILFISTPLII